MLKVIVTGASKGIGVGIAESLAQAGCSVGLTARTGDKLHALREQLYQNKTSDPKMGDAVYAVAPADLRDPAAIHDAIEHLVDEMQGVDALINNAGLVIRKSIWSLTDEEWRAMVDTNLSGVFYATRAVLPHLRSNGKGHIINISSISGRVPLPGGSAYAATKFGVTGFSESLFHEVRDYGIKVTVIFPGSVSSRSARHDRQADDTWKVTPHEVGDTCRDILHTAENTCIRSLEIRPLNRPGSTGD